MFCSAANKRTSSFVRYANAANTEAEQNAMFVQKNQKLTNTLADEMCV